MYSEGIYCCSGLKGHLKREDIHAQLLLTNYGVIGSGNFENIQTLTILRLVKIKFLFLIRKKLKKGGGSARVVFF